jgi:segregation and condensation protein B
MILGKRWNRYFAKSNNGVPDRSRRHRLLSFAASIFSLYADYDLVWDCRRDWALLNWVIPGAIAAGYRQIFHASMNWFRLAKFAPTGLMQHAQVDLTRRTQYCLTRRPATLNRGFSRLWQFRIGSKAYLHSPQNTGPELRETELARLEAVLFLAREPLSSRKIAKLANLADGTGVRTLIRRLREAYEAGGRAFQVEEVAGGYQLLTRPPLAPWLRRFQQTTSETRLSPPAMETLAVVAYRQPVLRAEIEAVRGVHCDEMLRQLLERDLVRIVGRSEDLGRPMLYGTTKRFLELFGLRSLEELPRAAEFQIDSPTVRNATQTSGDDSTDDPNASNAGASRPDDITNSDSILEENSVTTRIRPATLPAELVEDPRAAMVPGVGRPATLSPYAAKDEDEEDDADDEEDEDDDDWEDDDEEDDDLIDEEWEEVDDDEEDEDEEDEEEDDEEWEDEEDGDDDWDDDDDEEDDEEWEDEKE